MLPIIKSRQTLNHIFHQSAITFGSQIKNHTSSIPHTTYNINFISVKGQSEQLYNWPPTKFHSSSPYRTLHYYHGRGSTPQHAPLNPHPIHTHTPVSNWYVWLDTIMYIATGETKMTHYKTQNKMSLNVRHIFSYLLGVIVHLKSYVSQKTSLKLDMPF